MTATETNEEVLARAKALLKEAETWAGNDHGDRAMRLLPALIAACEARADVERALKSGLDKLRAEASRGRVPSSMIFQITDPLMDVLAR